MALIGFTGTLYTVNFHLVRYASQHLPAIMIDCANAACPHRYYPMIDLSDMQQIYVFELELLHKFRDVLKRLPLYVKRLNARSIIVTASDHLINYHDDKENHDIYMHAWQLMKRMSTKTDILVGVDLKSSQHGYAVKFCDRMENINGAHRQLTASDD